MFEVKEIKEKIAAVESELNGMASTIEREARNFNDDEIKNFDVKENEKAELVKQLATAERLQRNRGVSKPTFAAPAIITRKASKQDALKGWLLGDISRSEWQSAASDYGYRMDRNSIQRTDLGQDLGTSGAGGETIDGDIFVGILRRLKRYGGMRKVADVFTTANGNPIHFAYTDDTGNSGAIVGENTAPTSVPETFSKVSLSAFTYRSMVEPVSYELIQDSMIDIVAWLSESLSIRLARRQNLDWTSGNGSGKPRGFLLDSTNAVTTASPSAIAYAELNNLLHGLDPDYRDKDDGKVCVMMNDSTVAYLEQNIKDSQNRPLFLGPTSFGNVTTPSPLQLCVSGQVFPIVINQQMPSIGAGTTPIAFGWFGAYKARDVADVRVEIYRERYADLGAVGIQAFARADGALVDANAIQLLTMHA